MTDVNGIVTPKDMDNNLPSDSKKMTVKKRKIINKISKRLNQVTHSPARKE